MLSGMLPPKLLSLTLEALLLGDNQLSGSIHPGWFEHLHEGNANLTTLQLQSNRLTGVVPSEVGLIPLEGLFVDMNQLTGSLPVELFSLTSLRGLTLGHNDVSVVTIDSISLVIY